MNHSSGNKKSCYAFYTVSSKVIKTRSTELFVNAVDEYSSRKHFIIYIAEFRSIFYSLSSNDIGLYIYFIY